MTEEELQLSKPSQDHAEMSKLFDPLDRDEAALRLPPHSPSCQYYPVLNLGGGAMDTGLQLVLLQPADAS